jgi:hypothetical protein
MARTGLERGFAQAYLQGVKSGHAMGNMRSAYLNGFTDGTANMDKIQDPALLTGEKLPWIYVNADNYCTFGFTSYKTNLVTKLRLVNLSDWILNF